MTADPNHESRLRGTRTTSGEPAQETIRFKLHWGRRRPELQHTTSIAGERDRRREQYGFYCGGQESSQEADQCLL